MANLRIPDRNGYADCSSFWWLALTKAGYKTATRGTLWYTGSMAADARGARQYSTEILQMKRKPEISLLSTKEPVLVTMDTLLF
ncbi:hypothetical protein N8C69_15205 (plasmid) [Enterococcus faecium]